MAKRILFIFLFIVCIVPVSKAQLLAGGEIYYELIGPKKYKVTAHVYRLCDTDPLNALTGYVYGGSLGVSITFARTSIKKINDTCGNPCQKLNTVSNPGFEKHSFEATVDFNNSTYNTFVSNNICFVNFAVKQSGRAMSNTHDNGLFYIDAGVNICDSFIKKNHSPVFSMEPKFFTGCNQPFQYSPGPLDTFDYDSLAFSIEPILEGYKNNLSYKGGFSTTVPFTPYCPPNPNVLNCRAIPNAKPPRGFYFDSTYFSMIFTPTKCDDRGYVNLRIREYRKDPVTKKMVLLGFTSREMLLEIKQVPNNNPPGISPGSGQIPICSNLGIMKITTTDEQFLPKQTKPDSTYLFWDKGYKSGSLNVYNNSREKTADLLLPGDTLSTYGKQYFTIAAYDKTCNVSLVTRTFIGLNYPQVKFIKSYTIDSCNVFRFQLKSQDSSKLSGGTATIYSLTNQAPSSTIAFTDSFTFNTSGKFLIQYAIKNPQLTCTAVAFDTLEILNAFPKGQLNYKDTVVCSSYIAKLKFNPSIIPGLKSFAWYKNDSLMNTTDSQWSTTIYIASSVKLRLSAQNNCRSENKILFTAKTYKTDLLGNDPAPVCRSTEFSRHALYHSKSQPPFHYKWKFNGKDMNQDTNYMKFIITGNSKINVRLVDDNHCIIDDSLFVPAVDSFSFELNKNKEEICSDSTLVFTAGNITATTPYSLTWNIDGIDAIEKDTIISRTFNKQAIVLLTVKDTCGCVVKESIFIDPVAVPKVSFPTYQAFCQGKQIQVLPSFNPDVYPKIYEWKLDDNTIVNPDSFYLFDGSKTTLVKLKVSNRLGCSTEASTNIVVYPTPVPQIVTDTNYNPLNQIKLSTDKIFSSYQWFNGAVSRDNLFWASDLGAPGKYTVWCKVIDKNGCEGTDSVDIFTDKFTSIKDVVRQQVKVYPNPARNEFYIEVEKDCEMTLINAEGKTVLEQGLSGGRNAIDIHLLPVGLYIIRVADRHFIWMKE